MKKYLVLLLVNVVLFVGICGCQLTNKVAQDDSADFWAELIADGDGGKILIMEYEDNSNMINGNRVDRFDSEEFVDGSVDPLVTMEIWGSSYTFEYQQSEKLALTGQTVDVYVSQGCEYPKLYIDKQTGKIVEYFHFPYDGKEKTEGEYVNFARNRIDSEYDLSEYEYRCTTDYTWSGYTPSGISYLECRLDEPGFHICSENESLSEYAFYYTKSVNGVETLDYVKASFGWDTDDNGYFTLEIYDLGYSEDPFYELVNELDEVEEYVKGYAESNARYAGSTAVINDRELFMRGGEACVLLSGSIRFFLRDDQTHAYSAPFKIISRLNE